MNTITTAPSPIAGLLNDEEALSVYRAIPTEQDEGKRTALVGLLGQYTDAKRAQGMQPFQPSPDVQHAQDDRFEKLYSSLDTVESNLAPEQATQMKALLDTSPDPAAAKARMVNMAYLQQQHGNDLPPGWDGENWPAIRTAYAKQALGVDKPDVSDPELFGLIGKKVEKQKAERTMLTGVIAKVQMAAFQGATNWLDAYKGASDGMEADAGFDAQSRDRYRDIAKQAFEQVKDKADQLRPIADHIVVSLAREQGTRKGFEDVRGFSVDDLVQMVDSVPDQDRPLLYSIVAQMAGVSPETADAKDKGVVQQTGEAVGRGFADVMRMNKRALADNPALINARALAGAADKVEVTGQRQPGESLVDWATRSMRGNYGIVDFAKDVVTQNGQPFLKDRRKLTQDEQAALKDEVNTMQRTSAIKSELRQIAEGVVDPVKGSNFFTEKVYYPALQNAAYSAQAFVPYAGLPLLITSTLGMRSEEMMQRGMTPEDAQKGALVSAMIEAPVEDMQMKMVAGSFPIFKSLLEVPVAGLKQLAGRAAAVFGVQLLEQNAQEAIQDASPLVIQHVASKLSDSVPAIDWNKELADYGKGRVDTFWALMPMVLIGTGTATFSDAAYGRQYLTDMKTLKAAGFTEEAAAKIIEAPTLEEKQSIVRSSWNDERLRVMNGEAQLAALADMDSTMREAYVEATGANDGARINRLEDGSFEVTTPKGDLVDIAADADSALQLARDWNQADNLNMETAIQDMVAYVESFQEHGQSIEVVNGSRTLQDRVNAGDYTQEEADSIVDTYVGMGRLERGSTAADALITGENEVTRYDARRRIVSDVSRIYDGANPLTVVEEHAEGYLKRRLADGSVTLEDIGRWREAVDGAGAADNSERALKEWFSEQAQAYLVGKSNAEAVPASFRSFLMKLKQYFTRVMDLSVRLMQKEQAGELPDGFKTHLARSVGLDDAFVESQRRAEEQAALGGRGEELMGWLKGKLPHPDTARAKGEQLAGELQAVWDGFKSPQAARAFFAPKGEYTPLDQLAGMAKDNGFAFETADDLLKAIDSSLRGEQVFAESGAGTTYGITSRGQGDAIRDEMKMRRVAARVAAGEHAGESFAPAVRKAMEGLMYQVVPNKVTVADALKIVDEKGVSESMNIVMSATSDYPASVQVALGLGLMEHFNAQKDYNRASEVGERIAELGTELGRGVQVFSLLGRVLDTPEKAQVFLSRQVKKLDKAMRERQPAIDAAKEVLGDVQGEALKLLETWLDQINGVAGRPAASKKAVRVEDLPDITFALSQDMRKSGIVSVVSRMLVESGAVETRKALVERYGEKITPFLPDILIESQRLLMTRTAVKKAKPAKGGKADKGNAEAGKSGAPLPSEQVDATLAKGRAMGLTGEQTQLSGLEDLTKRFEDEVVSRMKLKGLDTPEAVRNAVRGVFETKGVNFTREDIAKVFAEKFQVPKATEAQRTRLAQLAENIRSTPDRSTERTDATVELMNHVNEILKPVDVIDKAWAVWYGNVLSGYNTHFRNMYANVMEQLVALPLDATRVNPVQTLQLMREMLFGVKAGASIGASEAKQQVKTGNASVLQTDSNKFGTAGTLERVKFAGGNANPFNWLNVVGRALRAEDLFAYATASEAKARMVAWEMASAKGFRGEERQVAIERLLNATEEQIGDFKERASREWDGLTKELQDGKDRGEWVNRRVSELRLLERDSALIERASEFAARATFNFKPDGFVGIMANGLTDALGRLSNVEATGKLETVQKALMTAPKLVVPFVRIVANVLNRGIDYTGFGVVRSVSATKRVGSVATGTEFVAKSADERAMELKRGIFGIVTLGVLSAMADPDDDKALIQIHGAGAGTRDRNQALNGPRWMPYSIEIRTASGSKFVTYQYSPLLLGLALVGNWHDARRYRKLDEKDTTDRLAVAATGIGSVLLDQSFLSNAADLVNMFGRDGQVKEQALYSFLGRTFNPATVAVPFSSLLRQMERDFDPVARDRPDIMASLMSQVPVAARFNEPVLDVLGDPIVNRPGDWFVRASADGTPEARIYRAFGEKDAVPTGIWTYKGKMEPAQFYQFTKERGAFLKESLMRNDAQLLKAIEAADSEVAAQIVENISRTATNVARARVGFIPAINKK